MASYAENVSIWWRHHGILPLILSREPLKGVVLTIYQTSYDNRVVSEMEVLVTLFMSLIKKYDDVIKWKHFPRYWPFVPWIHRSPVNSPHKGQWRGALMFSFNCAWINGWENIRGAGDLRHHRAHYDVSTMTPTLWISVIWQDSVLLINIDTKRDYFN